MRRLLHGAFLRLTCPRESIGMDRHRSRIEAVHDVADYLYQSDAPERAEGSPEGFVAGVLALREEP